MKEDDPYNITVGHWLASLSPLRKRLFDVAYALFDLRAFDWFGYNRWRKARIQTVYDRDKQHPEMMSARSFIEIELDTPLRTPLPPKDNEGADGDG